MTASKLTRERAQEILGRGRIDDARLVAVLATGATEDELVEAMAARNGSGSAPSSSVR